MGSYPQFPSMSGFARNRTRYSQLSLSLCVAKRPAPRPLSLSCIGLFFFRRFSAFLGQLFEFFGGRFVNTLAGDALA
jgi:hypothetical protein